MGIRERLIQCFVAVFPSLNEESVTTAEPNVVAEWDSVATVTLMSVVEEEFQIAIDPDDLENLLSFSKALAYVESKLN